MLMTWVKSSDRLESLHGQNPATADAALHTGSSASNTSSDSSAVNFSVNRQIDQPTALTKAPDARNQCMTRAARVVARCKALNLIEIPSLTSVAISTTWVAMALIAFYFQVVQGVASVRSPPYVVAETWLSSCGLVASPTLLKWSAQHGGPAIARRGYGHPRAPILANGGVARPAAGKNFFDKPMALDDSRAKALSRP
jgi:hypothetical protein